MEVIIEKLCKKDSLMNVAFSSRYGFGIAQWVGALPSIGNSYDVEIEIEDDLIWGEDITTIKENVVTMQVVKNLFYVTGKVLKYESDGCLSLSLGDSVLLLDVEGAPENLAGMVSCKAKQVKVYPTNI